jgi:hypothetical protein
MSKVGEGILRGFKQAIAIAEGTAKEGSYVVHTPAEIEASWKAEAERRVADVDAGTAVTSSWEEIEAPLRARLGKR